jgi:hypothetical protein
MRILQVEEVGLIIVVKTSEEEFDRDTHIDVDQFLHGLEILLVFEVDDQSLGLNHKLLAPHRQRDG